MKNKGKDMERQEIRQTQRKEFSELSKAKIRDNRNIVISQDSLGFITMAQQIVLNEDGRETAVFLKGAIEIETKNIYELRDAINEAISILENDPSFVFAVE